MGTEAVPVPMRVASRYLGGGPITRWRLLLAVAGDLATVLAIGMWVLTLNYMLVSVHELPLMAGIAVAALLIRRRLPALALVVATAANLFAALFCAYSAGYRISSWRRLLAVTGVALLAMMFRDGLREGSVTVSMSWLSALVAVVAWGLLVVLPVLAGRYAVQKRTLAIALYEHAIQLKREREILIEQTLLQERSRIAQDMHDSLGHHLTLIALHSGGLQMATELGAREKESLSLLRTMARTAMTELREIVGVLREGDSAPVSEPHTLAEADALVADAVAVGQHVRLERLGEPRPLPRLAEQAGYRALQEGLTNARKHAPDAVVTITLRYEIDAVITEVVNTSGHAHTGADEVISGGRGLVGLQERIRLAGGVLHATPISEGGFRLAAILPYESDGKGNQPSIAGAPATAVGALLPDDRGSDSGPVVPDPQRGGPTRGVLVTVGLVLGLLALVVTGGLVWMAGLYNRALLSPADFESVQVGQSEQEVLGRLPEGEWTFLDRALGARARQDVPEPAGARCRHYLSSDQVAEARHYQVAEAGNKAIFYRLCFKDATLIAKTPFVTPLW